VRLAGGAEHLDARPLIADRHPIEMGHPFTFNPIDIRTAFDEQFGRLPLLIGAGIPKRQLIASVSCVWIGTMVE
jgi:hypothetical protein